MAKKEVDIDGIGTVHLYKRSGAKSIRISISHKGEVRVSIPTWVPYSAGVVFAQTKKDWILAATPKIKMITQGYQIGKAHHITFQPGTGSSVTSRLTGNEVRILLPAGIRWDSQIAQSATNTAGVKALKKEARMLLPHRLATLAKTHNFTYSGVSIKQLKGRWGSCDEKKHIVLNCFLMQLSWDLIDYVLIHELVHTEVMAHGPRFWALAEQKLPDVQTRRKLIKTHQPIL
jgi:hypothetical protein